ncbi:(R)-1-hydroxy-2-trimethylaminoethylphosphonate oxygenase [Aestuariivirga sp.]|uniref:(R)-1-hydroxy-2-trimethylaminoethylphosphonate oxygenase n=1 Tax=Aestuariivirga sp. TaxID=2650926 RepID=UPI003BA94312
MTLDRSNIVEFIADIFERRGAESYLGEAVSMSEHMLQGAVLAEKEGAPEELVAAALLHDIGHYTSEFGPMSLGDARDNLHEEAGAHVLEPFFPPVITECVRLHVPAKRYLCATNADYFDRLSEASKHTLMLQGGPMSAEEVKAFEAHPYWREAVKVRIWDDEGKTPGVVTPEFRHYVPLLERVVAGT